MTDNRDSNAISDSWNVRSAINPGWIVLPRDKHYHGHFVNRLIDAPAPITEPQYESYICAWGDKDSIVLEVFKCRGEPTVLVIGGGASVTRLPVDFIEMGRDAMDSLKSLMAMLQRRNVLFDPEGSGRLVQANIKGQLWGGVYYRSNIGTTLVLVNAGHSTECTEPGKSDNIKTVRGSVYRINGADYLYYGAHDTCISGNLVLKGLRSARTAYHLVYGTVWSALMNAPGMSYYDYSTSCDDVLQVTVVGVVGDLHDPPHSGLAVSDLYLVSATIHSDAK